MPDPIHFVQGLKGDAQGKVTSEAFQASFRASLAPDKNNNGKPDDIDFVLGTAAPQPPSSSSPAPGSSSLPSGSPLMGPAGPVPESGASSVALSTQSSAFTTLTQAAVANWQSLGLTSSQANTLTQAQFLIADLPGTQLALTTGNLITIDVDAAGNGWFIDSTPTLNEEFTATNSAWEFQATPNNEAEGKIDLFTVIAHELGHAMGFIDRSPLAMPWILMTGLLPFGIRRLPTPFDFVPELGRSSAQPLEVWSSSTGTSVVLAASQAQYGPPHEGILSSNFAMSDPQSATFGWDRSGDVSIANGQAVLSEDERVISMLSQIFTLLAGSTHLRFTLVDVNLSSKESLNNTGF